MRLFLITIISLFFSGNILANCLPENIIPGEYLVRLQSVNNEGFETFHHSNKISSLLTNFESRVIHNQVSANKMRLSSHAKQLTPPSLLLVKDVNSKIYDLLQDDTVLSVEPNCMVYTTAVPNDTNYNLLWGHQVIQSENAWDISVGSKDIIVGISDTGVDYNHEDLKDNMWINEIEKNGLAGVDDDGNGYIDDIYGYDFADRNSDPRPGTAQGFEHGTHVAGTVGAVGNNSRGVVGVVWKTRLMALKGFRSNSVGASLADLLETIYYAADNGARVVNCSWGAQGSPSQAERDAISYALSKGTIPVVAAGNSTRDAIGFTPAGVRNALTVGASNSLDQLATFSNFGTIVDVIAPGGDFRQNGNGLNETIYSTYPMNAGRYAGIQGTSMAAPQVAGLAALILSINPNLSAQQVIDMIKSSGDLVEVTASNPAQSRFTYPRINAFKAAKAAQASLPPESNEPEPCVGDECSQGVGPIKLDGLANFNSNGCSYLSSPASAGSNYYLLLMLVLPVIFRFLFKVK